MTPTRSHLFIQRVSFRDKLVTRAYIVKTLLGEGYKLVPREGKQDCKRLQAPNLKQHEGIFDLALDGVRVQMTRPMALYAYYLSPNT